MKGSHAYLMLALSSILFSSFHNCKEVVFPEALKNTFIAKLKEVDSLIYYQCHTEKIQQQELQTESGQTLKLKSKQQFITITEKFKLFKTGAVYRLQYYQSPTTYFPNAKYAYLKLSEKQYWEFKAKIDTLLPQEDVLRLAAYETKLQAVTEYDFKVLENNGPQLIIKGRKVSEQFRLRENILLSKSLNVLKNGKK